MYTKKEEKCERNSVVCTLKFELMTPYFLYKATVSFNKSFYTKLSIKSLMMKMQKLLFSAIITSFYLFACININSVGLHLAETNIANVIT